MEFEALSHYTQLEGGGRIPGNLQAESPEKTEKLAKRQT